MKKQSITALLCIFLTVFCHSQEQRTVKGKVSDGKSPIENVNVSVVGKEVGTTTAADGSYEIPVETGDMLQFSYTGMKTVRILVEDVTRILNPIMMLEVTELDEVVVKGSNRKSQDQLAREYNINKSLIRTAYGIIDAETAAGQVRILNEDEINDSGACVLDVIRNQFPGVLVVGNCFTGGMVSIRGGSSINNPRGAMFDVDGMLFRDTPIWIVPAAIKRIAVLSSLSLTTRYGFFGGGGIIVVNTKAGSKFDFSENGKPYDHAKLRNNFADGKELTKEQLAANYPVYMRQLEAAPSFESAKAVYEEYAPRYKGSPYFFLDAYRHFYEKWDEAAYADGIIEENLGLFGNNAVLLKALAYHYEAQGRFARANDIFKEVFILRPNYAQSYMDMANGYRNVGKAKEAAAIYARYDYLLEEGFMQPDTVGFGPIIEREFNNLLMLNRDKIVDVKKSKKLYVAEEDFEGTRLVFEWNDSEAEFELQFVNPMGQYYKWKHSLADNEEAIMAEKLHGYACTEYLIDGSLPGTWKVNVNYLGNKSLTPTYLKATVYHDYGTPSQRKEVKVFKLSLKNVNRQLFSLQKSSSVVAR